MKAKKIQKIAVYMMIIMMLLSTVLAGISFLF
ncbi:stressosome-associated protein Prli42 [Bacillus massiliigorillae]|nr:stressosome-associated protein Prli42 [Bacillus massiliigorillae]